MTDSENAAQSGPSPSSGGAAPIARRKRARTRRKPARRGASPGRRPASRREKRSKKAGFERLVNDLAKRASKARLRIADFSEEGTEAARRTIGKVTAGSKKTIARVKREWDQMDTARRAGFVAALLAALAAASAGVARATKK